jgi:hypothetical protein
MKKKLIDVYIDNPNHVIVNDTVIAIALVPDGMVTLQGMDRNELVKKIMTDCPIFTKANNITNKHYRLFSSIFGKAYFKKNCK